MLNKNENTKSVTNENPSMEPYDLKSSPEFLISDIVTLTEIWADISDRFSDPAHSQVFLLFREIQDRAERALVIIEADVPGQKPDMTVN